MLLTGVAGDSAEWIIAPTWRWSPFKGKQDETGFLMESPLNFYTGCQRTVVRVKWTGFRLLSCNRQVHVFAGLALIVQTGQLRGKLEP